MLRPSILIVDDVAAVRSLVRELLRSLNAHITEAADGAQALELALANKFDLIITDYEMPIMDGVSLCQALKNNKQTMGLPVIMLTNFDSSQDITRGFEAGAEAYISKSEARIQLLLTTKKTIKSSQFTREQRILIVDDDNCIRNLLVESLSRAGFQTSEAVNGKEALQSITTQAPDLILSDINMPEMDGFELSKAVKSNRELSSIPFVVMSANADRAQMVSMVDQGVACYITKPFNLNELVILINRLLSDQYLLLLKDKKLLAQERDHLLASITGLISALEARDAYTKGHSESVGRIVTGMLALTGASVEEIERLHIGAQLHDMGKIGVRDNVLLKEGKLTLEEFEQIKQHPTIGTKIIEAIPSLSDVISVVQHHHERWDGKGYPSGLKGEETSLWARMTAVADAFDAMTSDRPYRKGMPREKAQQIIGDASATQFCPDCVDLFMQWLATEHDPNQEGED